MNYINNWQRPFTLGAADTSAALDLPDGAYRLTLSDAARAAFEYVDAIVVSGAAQLTRALEGSAAQAWPAGSVIYCSVTAGVLADIGGAGTGTGAADSGWIALTPIAPSYEAPHVRLLNGVVWFRGGVFLDEGSYNVPIAQLPESMRSNANFEAMLPASDLALRVFIERNDGSPPGAIYVNVRSGAPGSSLAVFDGLAFPVD
jgi:hypothetical protein